MPGLFGFTVSATGYARHMTSQNSSTSVRAATALTLALAVTLGVSACDNDDDDGPDTTLVDDLQSDPNVPFDPDVPGGNNTDTNELNNQGFDSDEPGPVGNQTDPND